MIKLFVGNGQVAVWDIQDIRTLRVDHHISGVLSGTLPQVGQQNVFLGLPLLLFKEEVVCLIRNNLAVLVDNHTAHLPPKQEQSESYHSQRALTAKAQQDSAAQNEAIKREKMSEFFKDEIVKRRKEKELKRAAHTLPSTTIPTPTPGLDSLELFIPAIETVPLDPSSSTKAIKPIERTSNHPYQISILPSSSSLPWFSASSPSSTYSTLESAREAGIWDYPRTEHEESRCKVYEDLWRKGFFLGIGLRFGGDFLIYPGDSLRYHSHFTLTILTSPTTAILPLDIVAYGRLATAVKKAHLLAAYDAKTDRIEYLSLEWAAFG